MANPPIIWRPNSGGQWNVLRSPHWQLLVDGDRGGGKTDVLIWSYLKYVGKGYGPGWNGIIFRRTFPELRQIIARSHRWISRVFPGAKFNKNDKEWTFPDGESLIFSYLRSLADYEHYHGHSYAFIGFEELCNWPTDECYTSMLSCSRSEYEGVPLRVRANTNSWGAGHSWVKARFVDHSLPLKPSGEPGRERIRIPVQWAENSPYRTIDPDYHIRLAEEITNEAQLQAWLHGSWDIMAGGYFADVWRDGLHWIEPFDIPYNWAVDRSHDWGSSAPFCTLWFAESNGEALPDGRRWPPGTLFVINEDYGCKGDPNKPNWKPNVGLELLPKDISIRTKSVEERMLNSGMISKKSRPGPGDDPLWDVSRGESMAKQMADAGIIWSRPKKGPGSRVTGWMSIAAKLKAGHQQPMEEPGLFVFQNCLHLHRTLPSLPRDIKNPDDIDSSTEDHAADALRLRCLEGAHGPVIREVNF